MSRLNIKIISNQSLHKGAHNKLAAGDPENLLYASKMIELRNRRRAAMVQNEGGQEGGL